MALPTVASVVSSGLAAYPTVYYDRTAVDFLYSNLVLYGAAELKTMPDRSGVTLQIFDHTKISSAYLRYPKVLNSHSLHL